MKHCWAYFLCLLASTFLLGCESTQRFPSEVSVHNRVDSEATIFYLVVESGPFNSTPLKSWKSATVKPDESIVIQPSLDLSLLEADFRVTVRVDGVEKTVEFSGHVLVIDQSFLQP